MKKIANIIDKITIYFGILAGFFMILGVLIIMTEIITRSFFNSTIYITAEYTAYLMVALTLLGFAITLKDNEHIRVTFLHTFIIKRKTRFILDLYSFILGLIVSVLITIALTNFLLQSIANNSTSMQLTKTYLAIPQSTLVLGSLLLTFQFLAEIIKLILKYKNEELNYEKDKTQMLGR